MDRLTDDSLLLILSYGSLAEAARWRRVSRRFYNLVPHSRSKADLGDRLPDNAGHYLGALEGLFVWLGPRLQHLTWPVLLDLCPVGQLARLFGHCQPGLLTGLHLPRAIYWDGPSTDGGKLSRLLVDLGLAQHLQQLTVHKMMITTLEQFPRLVWLDGDLVDVDQVGINSLDNVCSGVDVMVQDWSSLGNSLDNVNMAVLNSSWNSSSNVNNGNASGMHDEETGMDYCEIIGSRVQWPAICERLSALQFVRSIEWSIIQKLVSCQLSLLKRKKDHNTNNCDDSPSIVLKCLDNLLVCREDYRCNRPADRPWVYRELHNRLTCLSRLLPNLSKVRFVSVKFGSMASWAMIFGKLKSVEFDHCVFPPMMSEVEPPIGPIGEGTSMDKNINGPQLNNLNNYYSATSSSCNILDNIHSLTINGYIGESMDFYRAAVGRMSQLADLQLSNIPASAGGAGRFYRLMTSSLLSNLRHLSVSWCGLDSDDLIGWLAANGRNGQLVTLRILDDTKRPTANLRSNQLIDILKILPNLQSLECSCPKIGNSVLDFVGNHHGKLLTRLSHLSLVNTRISSGGVVRCVATRSRLFKTRKLLLLDDNHEANSPDIPPPPELRLKILVNQYRLCKGLSELAETQGADWSPLDSMIKIYNLGANSPHYEALSSSSESGDSD